MFRPPAVRDRVPGRYAARRLSAYVNHVYFYVWDRDFGGWLPQGLHVRPLEHPRMVERP